MGGGDGEGEESGTIGPGHHTSNTNNNSSDEDIVEDDSDDEADNEQDGGDVEDNNDEETTTTTNTDDSSAKPSRLIIGGKNSGPLLPNMSRRSVDDIKPEDIDLFSPTNSNSSTTKKSPPSPPIKERTSGGVTFEGDIYMTTCNTSGNNTNNTEMNSDDGGSESSRKMTTKTATSESKVGGGKTIMFDDECKRMDADCIESPVKQKPVTSPTTTTPIKSALKQPKQTVKKSNPKKTPPSTKKSPLGSQSIASQQSQSGANTTADSNTFARSYTKSPYGWLVDFINHFGELNGFGLLLERFTSNTAAKLNIQVITALLKPWGLCYQFLTPQTVRNYFLPCIEIVKRFFEQLSDVDIAKECKSENKNDSISTVIKWLKLLASRCHNQQELCKNLEILRLKTILRILKFASFNGKMNALNEVNKVTLSSLFDHFLSLSSIIKKNFKR